MKTDVLQVDSHSIGAFTTTDQGQDLLDELHVSLNSDPAAEHIKRAADQLRASTVPVAFPTETVYGLGADATRSEAVRGIYAAKQRPSDNPLIVHFASLHQLRALLRHSGTEEVPLTEKDALDDPIPLIYHPLIRQFWPGPLTIILPTPQNSQLAPEVTAGLSTFGARIPRHPIALALIELAGVPIAAPSANASTKPSPTAAEHVLVDLDGRIETIIDGGPCAVGVESTVVDGLSSPPSILRPGGISIEQLRSCPGWESVEIGYHDAAERDSRPKAPGMKYRHYSPKAPVILYESNQSAPDWEVLSRTASTSGAIGLLRSRHWRLEAVDAANVISSARRPHTESNGFSSQSVRHSGFAGMLAAGEEYAKQLEVNKVKRSVQGKTITIYDIELGHRADDIARGIFAALRKLDQHSVDAIFVEGIDDSEDDLAAAVMNRLRKAAERTV